MPLSKSELKAKWGVSSAVDAPEYSEVSDFVPPQYDVGRVRRLTQEEAAPSLRRERFSLVKNLQEARRYGERRGNPLAGQLRRGVLSARGQTVTDIMGGARQRAQGIYAPEYGAALEAERSRVQTDRDRAEREYEFSLREYYDDEAKKSAKQGGARRPRGRTTYLSSRPSSGGGGTGSFGSTTAAIQHFTGARPTRQTQASSSLYWASDDDQRSAIKLSEATGKPLSDYYSGSIARMSQTDRDSSFLSEYGL